MQAWPTTVDFLIANFRQALLSLLPFLEAARIPWREEEAYDEWDEISESLFENLVLRSIRWGVGDDAIDSVRFPKYGYAINDYSEFSIVEVCTDMSPAGKLAFLGFETTQNPLDKVRCLEVLDDGSLSGQDVLATYEGSHFRVWLRDEEALRGPITDLRVKL